jgi:hypothetical protein
MKRNAGTAKTPSAWRNCRTFNQLPVTGETCNPNSTAWFRTIRTIATPLSAPY